MPLSHTLFWRWWLIIFLFSWATSGCLKFSSPSYLILFCHYKIILQASRLFFQRNTNFITIVIAFNRFFSHILSLKFSNGACSVLLVLSSQNFYNIDICLTCRKISTGETQWPNGINYATGCHGAPWISWNMGSVNQYSLYHLIHQLLTVALIWETRNIISKANSSFQLPLSYCDYLAKHFRPYETIIGGLLYGYWYHTILYGYKTAQMSITQTIKAQLALFSIL